MYVAVLAGCSIHHKSDELGDGAVDGPGDGRLGDAGDIGGVPGLVLWLNGGVGVTHDAANRVSRWADQSGHANDAFPASDANAPLFVAQSIDHQPGIHFGVIGVPQLTIADSSSLKWGTGDYVIEVVVAFKNPPPQGVINPDATPCLFQKTGTQSGGGGDGIALQGNSEAGAGAAGRNTHGGNSRFVRVVSPLDNGTPHVIALRRNADVFELRVDGAVANTTTGDAGIDISTDTAATLGSLFGGQAGRVDGDIDEVVGVTGTGATSHLNVVESYLMTKYGI